MLRSLVVIVLLGSLGANAWFVARSANPPARRVTHASPQPIPHPKTSPEVAGPAPSPAAPTSVAGYRTLQATLEREGLPPRVAKVVLAVLLEYEFYHRAEALAPASEIYWRRDDRTRNAEHEAAAMRLESEMDTMKRQLGVAHVLDNPWDDFRSVRFGKLAAGKKSAVRQILTDYREMETELGMASRSDDEEAAQNRKTRSELLQREMRADIARLLTPEELRAFDYLNDPAGNKLRQRFGEFEAAEGEFIALFPQVQALLATINEAGYATVEKQIDGALRQTMGDTRYQQMKETNDRQLQDTRRFVSGVHLPVSLASTLVAVEREFSAKEFAVRQDRDISPNQRDRQIQVLATEKTARLNQLLGPHAEAYSKRESLLEGSIGCGFGRRSTLL